jgi:ATP-binding protein involved in chromosome partitioning
MKEARIEHFNIDMGCDLICEGCEKYLDCTAPEKTLSYERRRMEIAREVMKNIKHKILVIGGKGGVGKSLITANLAAALAMKGKKVTVLDQSYDAPVVCKMLGFSGKKMRVEKDGIIPSEGLLGIQLVSMGLILEEDEVLTWFHEMKRNATEEFLCHVIYGNRDYLVVDVPAGTSSDTVNLLEYVPDLDGVVVVTIPSQVSQFVAKRAIMLSQKIGAKIIGVIENMRGFTCPECHYKENILQIGGGEILAKELDVPFIGGISLDPRISEASDEGVPFVYKYPDIEGSEVIRAIADEVERQLGEI